MFCGSVMGVACISTTFSAFISETEWFACMYACSMVGSIFWLTLLALLYINAIYTWYSPPRLRHHPRVLRRKRGRIYMHNGAVHNMRGLVLYKELPTSQPLSNELKRHLRFIRPSGLELQECTGSRGGAVSQVSRREMCRSGASFMTSTPQGTHLVWQQESCTRERGAGEGKTQRPEACRSARVPIEMPRIQNPGTGSRFPPEHSGQQSRQFGESLSEHTEGGRSFVTSVKKQNTVQRVGLKQV